MIFGQMRCSDKILPCVMTMAALRHHAAIVIAAPAILCHSRAMCVELDLATRFWAFDIILL